MSTIKYEHEAVRTDDEEVEEYEGQVAKPTAAITMSTSLAISCLSCYSFILGAEDLSFDTIEPEDDMPLLVRPVNRESAT